MSDCVYFILQYRPNSRSVLAKKRVRKQVNRHYFLSFTPYLLSIFKNKTRILHHLAFLDWSPPRIFSSPITPFLPLKSHFLTTISPFPTMFFMVRKGYVYTIYGGYLCFSPRILQHFTLRFAPFYLVFSTKTHYILHQNTLRLAAYCTAFCTKTHYILLQIAPKRVLVAVILNKKSSRLFPLPYLFQKNQYKCDIVPSLPTGLCGIEPVEHAPV